MLRVQLLLIPMAPQPKNLMVTRLKILMVPQPMMTMVQKVLLIMIMLRVQLLLIPMVPQLKNLMVPQLMMLMVPQLIMMFLPQNTATLPGVDVPDLATLADQPQLDLTETDQLPEDQLPKLQELADSSDQLLRPQEDKLVPNNKN